MAEDPEPVRLQINDQIQATIKGTDEEFPTNYLSRVEDIQGNDLIIGWPTHLGVRAPVRPGDVLSLFCRSQAAVMAFDARIVGKEQPRREYDLLYCEHDDGDSFRSPKIL